MSQEAAARRRSQKAAELETQAKDLAERFDAFVRLVSNPRVFSEPEPVADAWAQAEAWLDADPSWTPTPTSTHRDVLGRCLGVGGLGATDVPDAHLAALAIEHGLRLATTDHGFARFAELEWFDPLRRA